MRYFLHKGLYVFSVFALSILGFDVFATTANQAIQVTTYSDNRICFEDRLDFNLEISLKNNTLDTVQNVALTFLCPELSISNFNVNQSLLPGDTALVALNHLNIMAAGVHVVQIVTNRGGGESNDTSEVEVIILPSLQTNSLKDSTVCYNETTVFRAETGFSSYLWSNGTIGQSNTVNVAGMHNVTVTDYL